MSDHILIYRCPGEIIPEIIKKEYIVNVFMDGCDERTICIDKKIPNEDGSYRYMRFTEICKDKVCRRKRFAEICRQLGIKIKVLYNENIISDEQSADIQQKQWKEYEKERDERILKSLMEITRDAKTDKG